MTEIRAEIKGAQSDVFNKKKQLHSQVTIERNAVLFLLKQV